MFAFAKLPEGFVRTAQSSGTIQTERLNMGGIASTDSVPDCETEQDTDFYKFIEEEMRKPI